MSNQPEALRLAEFYEALAEEPPKSPENSNIRAAAAELRRLHAELERERMRLAACGVVALSDTPDSAKHARQMHPDYESASCQDVARRVDECISLRAQRDALLEEISALREVLLYSLDNQGRYRKKHRKIVDAAIKAVEGEKE